MIENVDARLTMTDIVASPLGVTEIVDANLHMTENVYSQLDMDDVELRRD